MFLVNVNFISAAAKNLAAAGLPAALLCLSVAGLVKVPEV